MNDHDFADLNNTKKMVSMLEKELGEEFSPQSTAKKPSTAINKSRLNENKSIFERLSFWY